MSFTRAFLLAGSAIALASCGADDVASPGDGVIIVPAPPAPPATPPAPPSPTPPAPTPTGGPAADCPAGTSAGSVFDYGTASTDDDARICQIIGTISGSLSIPQPDSTVGNRIYELVGRVDVGTDAGLDADNPAGTQGVLTIGAGNVVFGRQPQDFLVVQRGSQLNSLGERNAPVVFTSFSNLQGATGPNTLNDWGGIVIAGRAPYVDSDCTATQQANNTCDAPVEGTSGVRIGGNSETDTSGTIRYTSIRYAGFIVAPGDERQGLTLGGVGNGTTLEYLQIHNSADDGIEWFGGTVDGRYLVFTGNEDDSLDVDNGFSGVNQFIIVTQRTASSDHAIEADSGSSNEGLPRTDTVFANFTFVVESDSNSSRAVLLRGGADYQLVNGVIDYGTAGAECIEVRGSETLQAADPGNDENGPPEFHSVVMNCAKGVDGADGADPVAVQAIFDADANNDETFTISLTDRVVNGANETAVTAFDASTLDPFLVATNYIGAVEQGDDWFSPWACDLAGSPTCVTAPAPIEP